MINFKKKLRSIFTVENAPFLIVILFYITNINYIHYGGIFYDDWSLATGYLETDLLERIKINCLLFFNTRPVGGLYVALITSVGKNDLFYILLNSSLWVLSGLILHKTISKIYTHQTANIFLIFFLFPSFASTPFFSPVTQSLGGLSIFFWSLSLYFSYRKNFFLTFILYSLSILSYEVSVVLFLFNVFFFIKNDNNEKINKIIIYKQLKDLILKFSFLIFFIIILQFGLAKLTSNIAPLKYSFTIIDNQIIFESEFFLNIKKYFFKPLGLIFIDIPNLFLNSLQFIKFNFYNTLSYLAIVFVFIFIFFKKDKKYIHYKKADYYYQILFFIFIVFSSAFVFIMYLIVSSVPQVNGYYNRGLLGLFICYSFAIVFLREIRIKKKQSKLLSIFLFIFIFLNFNSFFIQKNNHIDANKKREEILIKVKNFFKNKNPSNLVMFIPTYLSNNYNDEVIFSEEVGDLNFAIRYITKGKVEGSRVFYSPKCANILNINNNSIYGYVPSRNKKNKNKILITLIDKIDNKDLYLFYNNKFVKLTNNNLINNQTLNKNIKCSL
jgi:hypothetical protein